MPAGRCIADRGVASTPAIFVRRVRQRAVAAPFASHRHLTHLGEAGDVVTTWIRGGEQPCLTRPPGSVCFYAPGGRCGS